MSPFQRIVFEHICEKLTRDHYVRCEWWRGKSAHMPIDKLEKIALEEALAQNEVGFYLSEDHRTVRLTDGTLRRAVIIGVLDAYKALGIVK